MDAVPKHPIALAFARRELSDVLAGVVARHLRAELFGVDPGSVVPLLVERALQLAVAVGLAVTTRLAVIACGLRHVPTVGEATVAVHADVELREAVWALQAALVVAQVRQVFWTKVARDWAHHLDCHSWRRGFVHLAVLAVTCQVAELRLSR